MYSVLNCTIISTKIFSYYNPVDIGNGWVLQIITVEVFNGTKSIPSFTEIGQLSENILMSINKLPVKTGTLILLCDFISYSYINILINIKKSFLLLIA
jgi:hypothetical protein